MKRQQRTTEIVAVAETASASWLFGGNRLGGREGERFVTTMKTKTTTRCTMRKLKPLIAMYRGEINAVGCGDKQGRKESNWWGNDGDTSGEGLPYRMQIHCTL
jgi:hypothetical protein